MVKPNSQSLIIIGFLILVAVLFFQYKQIQNLRSDSERWQQNFSQKDSMNRNLYFSKKEFKEYVTINNSRLFDTLTKIAGFKVSAKNIKEVTTYTYTYHNKDTILVDWKSVNDTVFSFNEYVDSCLQVEGYLFLPDNKLYFTETKFNNTMTDIFYFKRAKGFLGFRIGKKEYFRETMNTCPNSTVQSERIEIGKQ